MFHKKTHTTPDHAHAHLFKPECVEISWGVGGGGVTLSCVRWIFFPLKSLKKAAIFGFLRLVFMEKNKGRKEGGAFTKQEVGRKRYLEINLHLNI